MLKANLCKICYIPVFSLFAVLPFIHDVIPYHNSYDTEDWSALAGMYALGFLLSSPLFFLLKKADKSGNGSSLVSILPRVIFTLILQIMCLYFFWEKSAYLYLSMAVVIALSATLFAVGKRGLNLIKDKDTGNLYEIRGNKAYKLTAEEATRYDSSKFGNAISVAEFSSSQYSGFDSASSVLPLDYASGTAGYNQGIVINPSSGMPMVGGISGIDVHGNSWGTNFNEPTNTYDPNRGY